MDALINLIDFITNKLNLTIIGENLHDDTECCGKQARHEHYLSVNNNYVFLICETYYIYGEKMFQICY